MTDPAVHGVHDYEDDPRNDTVLVMVNGARHPRAEAVVSVFDAGFVLGDGVWEGLGCTAATPCSSSTSTGSSRGPRRWRSTSV